MKNREIKFRAWDKKTKSMRVVDSMAFYSERGFVSHHRDDEEGLPKVFNLWGRDCIEDKDIIMHREKDECILMQYTGRKDKNGKEIYEGDIVKWVVENDGEYSCGQTEIFMQVIWWENGWYVEDKDQNNGGRFEEFGDDELKVVGNIYENTELLNS